MQPVHKNIPIPIPVRTRGMCRKYPFDTMGVGDMFFVAGKIENTLKTLAWKSGQRLHRKFTTRLCFMREVSRHGIKCWELCDPAHPRAVQGIGVWRLS